MIQLLVSSAGQGNSDTVDGGNGTDTLQLSAVLIHFLMMLLFKMFKQLHLNASGTNVNLTGQTEGLTITGGAGNDIITAGSGNDIIMELVVQIHITGAGGSDTISLGSSDSASDIVYFNSSSGSDIINQFNAGAVMVIL